MEFFDPGQGLRKTFGPGGRSARTFYRGEVLERTLEVVLESQVEKTLEAAQVVRAVRFVGEGRPWHLSVLFKKVIISKIQVEKKASRR